MTFLMKPLSVFAGLFLLAPILSSSTIAAERARESLLPRNCIEGWVADGKVVNYTPENLYKYINGEAELYLPYGFEKAETVMYIDPAGKGSGLVVNVFKMGSLLEAFGIYSNYRSAEAEPAKVGAEGFVEESQLMFYQGPYFVQIMASGSMEAPPFLFLACAGRVSGSLPGDRGKPPELDLLNVPGVVPRSERYYAQGLLGYAFFGRGLTAEVSSEKGKAKLFVALGDSADSMKGAIEAYAKQLRESKAKFRASKEKGGRRLAAVDPLYKGVLIQQSGRFAVGVSGLTDPLEGESLLALLLPRLPRQ